MDGDECPMSQWQNLEIDVQGLKLEVNVCTCDLCIRTLK